MILEFLITVFLMLVALLPPVIFAVGTMAVVLFITNNYEPTPLPVLLTVLASTLGFSLIISYVLVLLHHFP